MSFKPEYTTMYSIPYFLGFALTIAFGVLGWFLLRKKSVKFKHYTILGLFLFNFVLHFLKIFNSYYQNRLPEYYATITFDNICAVSTILFAFTYLGKNKVIKDYMFYMGVLSGLAALCYPTGGVLNRAPYAFDYFRFYICHGIIVFGPVYMVVFGLHKLDWRRIWQVPFVFWAVLSIIFLNTIICAEIGITDIRSQDFLSPGYERNASLVFGYTKQFENVIAILLVFVPKFLKYVPFGPYAGQLKVVPLVWLFIPAYIYLAIIAFLLCLPFEHKKIKSDLKFVCVKINAAYKKVFLKDKNDKPKKDTTNK